MEGVSLTKREIEILQLTAQGNSSSRISEKFGITKSTLNSHRVNIHKKFGVKNQIDAISIGVNLGIIDRPKINDRFKDSLTKLNSREIDVLIRITKGDTINEIASRLNLSESSIKAYRKSISRKFNEFNFTKLTWLLSNVNLEEFRSTNQKYNNVYNPYNLTLREIEVLKTLRTTSNVYDASKLLKISINTVKQHKKNAFKKLGVHKLTEAFIKIDSLDLFSEKIIREFLFKPEQIGAAKHILEYFGKILDDLHPKIRANVRIEQIDGGLVMFIKYPNEEDEKIIKKLFEDYKDVVSGNKRPEELLEEPEQIQRLAEEMEVALFRMRSFLKKKGISSEVKYLQLHELDYDSGPKYLSPKEKNLLFELHGKGNLQMCINLLIKRIKELEQVTPENNRFQKVHSEIQSLRFQLNEVESNVIKGLITNERRDLIKNNISSSLIDLINEF